MFKSIGNLFARLSLGAIVRNITLDVDTIEKKSGYFLRIRVEVFGFKILDELVKLSGQTSSEMRKDEVLKIEDPINVLRSNNADERRLRWAKDAEKRLQKSLNRRQE